MLAISEKVRKYQEEDGIYKYKWKENSVSGNIWVLNLSEFAEYTLITTPTFTFIFRVCEPVNKIPLCTRIGAHSNDLIEI